MAEYNPLSPIQEVDEDAIAREEAEYISRERKFTLTMSGEELIANTILLRNVNKAIQKRIEQYNEENVNPEDANRKLERFVSSLQLGLDLFQRTYDESVELMSENVNYAKYLTLPDLSELNSVYKNFLDNYVKITKKQLQDYLVKPISQDDKEHKAEGLQQEILELVNAMLRITNPSRQLNITHGSIVGGKKSRRKRKMKRTRKINLV